MIFNIFILTIYNISLIYLYLLLLFYAGIHPVVFRL